MRKHVYLESNIYLRNLISLSSNIKCRRIYKGYFKYFKDIYKIKNNEIRFNFSKYENYCKYLYKNKL